VISFLKRNCTCTLLLAVKIFYLEKGPGFEFRLFHLNLVVPVDKNGYHLSIKLKITLQNLIVPVDKIGYHLSIKLKRITAKWVLNMKTFKHHLIK